MDDKNLELIRHNLEENLNQEFWSKKEYNLYTLLLGIVKKYEPSATTYLSNRDDVITIKKNIMSQSWFNKNNCELLLKLIDFMVLKHYKIERNLLEVTAEFVSFTIKIRYYRQETEYEYQIYFESGTNNQYKANKKAIHRGYLINTTSQNDHITSPDFTKIKSICHRYNMTHFDIIHLAHELLSFYDSNGEIKDLHMSTKYPITLEKCANIIKQS